MKRIILSTILLTGLFSATNAQLRVHDDGRLSVGTLIKKQPWQVNMRATTNGYFFETNHSGGGGYNTKFDVNHTSTKAITVSSPSGETFIVYGGGLAVSLEGFWDQSDLRLKENILDIQTPMEKISSLRGVSYTLKAGSNKSNYGSNERIYGFIAQEIEQVLPEAVITEEDGLKAVSYNQVIPILVEALKAQQIQIDELSKKLTSARIEYLREGEIQQFETNEPENRTDGPFLFQNSPNPFSENTSISYGLRENINSASIHVYNMNGLELKAINLDVSVREGSVEITGQELEAGMYLYSLIIDDELVDTKRMVLTK